MEIRDIEDFLTDDNKGKPWKYTNSDIEVIPIEIVKEIAIEFAKQFIDLAASKDLIEYSGTMNVNPDEWDDIADYSSEYFRENKQSILDIKQLIK